MSVARVHSQSPHNAAIRRAACRHRSGGSRSHRRRSGHKCSAAGAHAFIYIFHAFYRVCCSSIATETAELYQLLESRAKSSHVPAGNRLSPLNRVQVHGATPPSGRARRRFSRGVAVSGGPKGHPIFVHTAAPLTAAAAAIHSTLSPIVVGLHDALQFMHQMFVKLYAAPLAQYHLHVLHSLYAAATSTAALLRTPPSGAPSCTCILASTAPHQQL